MTIDDAQRWKEHHIEARARQRVINYGREMDIIKAAEKLYPHYSVPFTVEQLIHVSGEHAVFVRHTLNAYAEIFAKVRKDVYRLIEDG